MTTGVVEPESEGEVMYEPFELQPSLLDTVAAVCPEHEAEEIWRVVGPSLVEQAKDLLQEAKLHLEIWRELMNNNNSRDSEHVTSHGLPEPPLVRERLIKEIHFLADHLRSKPGSSTMEFCTTHRSREVLSYALTSTTPQQPSQEGGGASHRGSRPPSVVSSRDGRETPLRRATPSSQDGSRSSVQSWGDGGLLEHVSMTAIDSTVQHLRELLEEEVVQRQHDIAFLQECSEGERDYHHHSTSTLPPPPPPPSLRELRTIGTLLEREVMSGTSRTSPNNSPIFPRPPPGECPLTTVTLRTSRYKPRPIQPNSAPSISVHDAVMETIDSSSGTSDQSRILTSRYSDITTTAATPLHPIS